MRHALTALLCLPLLLLGACSSGSGEPDLPAQTQFRDGTCRTTAPDLLSLGRTLPRLGDGPSVEPAAQEALLEVQNALVTAVGSAPPAYAAPLQDLVESIGGVRIRAAGNTYEPALAEDLRGAYERVLEVCTAPG